MHEDRDWGGAERRLAICNIYEHISLTNGLMPIEHWKCLHRKYILKKRALKQFESSPTFFISNQNQMLDKLCLCCSFKHCIGIGCQSVGFQFLFEYQKCFLEFFWYWIIRKGHFDRKSVAEIPPSQSVTPPEIYLKLLPPAEHANWVWKLSTHPPD